MYIRICTYDCTFVRSRTQAAFLDMAERCLTSQPAFFQTNRTLHIYSQKVPPEWFFVNIIVFYNETNNIFCRFMMFLGLFLWKSHNSLNPAANPGWGAAGEPPPRQARKFPPNLDLGKFSKIFCPTLPGSNFLPAKATRQKHAQSTELAEYVRKT